jgi:plasmid maintenance system antidote protein VapI
MKNTQLAKAIAAQDQTAASVAKAAKIHPNHLSALVHGRRQPSVGVALRVSVALGVSVESLFSESAKARRMDGGNL